SLLGVVSSAASCVFYVLLALGLYGWILVPLVFFLMALMAVYVVSYPRYRTEQVLMAFFGVFYVAVMISYLYQIRVMENGAFLVWLVFISSWGCDTCAYCVGMLFGKHKMTPVLSPKKSVEGGIGGLAGAGLLGVIFALVFREHLTVFAHPVWMLGIIGVVGGAISVVGDLTASAIKRNFVIKDYVTEIR
ncbi:MAG: phosphatidate cytidylyltransferase, partial [Lachnospiraceae bacterium]|nr:phosphatidate cytidylyltransferase [Lachnospiraceae bacterium]